jgi:NADH:ubiquinone oxidoreductase subunit K
MAKEMAVAEVVVGVMDMVDVFRKNQKLKINKA